jgi:hypothetical protein
LTAAEIKQLLKQVQEEHSAKSNFSAMPIYTIAAKPEVALAHYKSLLGQIRQLALLTDPVAFDRTAKASDNPTGTETAF